MELRVVEALDLRIRLAAEDDLPALEWEGEFIRFRRMYREAMKEAQKGRRLILIAEVNGQVIGQVFINLYSTWRNSFFGSKAGYLHSFRVRPAYRNQGIGRSLILEAERLLAEQGYRHVVISVAKTNQDARRLYEQLDYQVFREDPGRWSFMDHQNQVQHIHEPAFILRKRI
jgi:ribosomal protein S18 acetylase RimI-like enzyme